MDLARRAVAFKAWFQNQPQLASLCEPVRNENSPAAPQTTESEALRVGPSDLCFTLSPPSDSEAG